MSKRVYLALRKAGEPAPFELLEWTLAERFGWTLDYIESLTLGRLVEFYQIEDARAKRRAELENNTNTRAKWRKR